MKSDILRLLEENGKLSPDEIAVRLDLDVEKVEEVIEQLEDEQVIVKYCALVDWDKTDREIVTALIDVKVTPERGIGFDAVAKRIYKFPEVSSVFLMSGGYDLSVKVEERTMKEVALFVAEKLATIDQIQSTATHFMLKTYKKDGVVFNKGKQEDERLVISP
ncbi:Lrp/AsnC family transcriptional regulator [Natroniella sulfidigena]|uniref:Lrp/AsnC family transcriptional regulator n=1 Tax=Natroniella sulfidigena TaxID=723921 RepID=UPI00200AB0CD|nr:Lrp/AsnC family transcriptional regulator [Natroniella sulfidigena]MCK8816792.1 Lrp/AsnC family transcriptional regulator [Natroniella sulfidigena]